MLVEFSVENYLSFKELTTLSMVAAKSFKEHQDSHTIPVPGKFSLLKSAIIFGDNGSGKSNFLLAMGFMKNMVLNSFRDALMENTERKLTLEKFALSTVSDTDTSFFEIIFFQEGTRYRYGFEMDETQIAAEWLFHTTSREVPLFTRTFQTIEVNKSGFEEGIGKEMDVKENVLFLSLLATLGKPISSAVVAWFKNFNLINGIHDRYHKRYTIDKLKSDEKFFSWVHHFIRYLEISHLSTTEEDVFEVDMDRLKEEQKDEEIINLLTSIQKVKNKQTKRDQIITYHRKYDENNLLVDTVSFIFDRQESEGTIKLLYLLGPWYDTLQKGKVLIIDELDARLHSRLTLRLVRFFHAFNTNKAQLIFAAHDVSLLNKDEFRRDQIWFVEKNQFGASGLYSLADFKTDKVRNKSAFDKNYLNGNYGAVPYFDQDAKLKDILYE
jgi:AAA15 family ATPase/GTPase